MTALGIPLIAIGIALICAGVVFRPRALQTDPAAEHGPDQFRTVLNALGVEDRHDENQGLNETAENAPPTDPAAGAMTEPARQRRPQLG